MIVAALSLAMPAQPPSPPLAVRPVISALAGGIKGEVHTRKGVPVPGVRLTLQGPDGRTRIAFTDEKGRFQAGELPPGTHRLELSKPGHQAVTYPGLLIKANAWLLGIAPAPRILPQHGLPPLAWIGPPDYERPPAGVLKTPPRKEQIPMH